MQTPMSARRHIVEFTNSSFGGLYHSAGELLDHAKHYRDKVVPAMSAVRAIGDQLETIIADDLWPLPTYREMLFIK